MATRRIQSAQRRSAAFTVAFWGGAYVLLLFLGGICLAIFRYLLWG